MCERRGTGTERSKNLREQSGERESKNRAQQSGALSGRSRSGRGAVSEDHRNGNAERQNSPLRSAPMLCTGVIESMHEKVASYIFVLIVYSHKVLSDTTIKQSI